MHLAICNRLLRFLVEIMRGSVGDSHNRNRKTFAELATSFPRALSKKREKNNGKKKKIIATYTITFFVERRILSILRNCFLEFFLNSFFFRFLFK